ncbi:MAG: hypothetical protein V3U54_01230 [Thermodesulfobacteriota bacterium]
MKTIQLFSDEYLDQCKRMKTEQILKFLDDFRLLYSHSKKQKTILISIKVPENLLNSFKTKAKLNGTPYQTQIKRLMKEWIETYIG